MGRWGSVDLSQLTNLQRRLERLASADLDKFCKDMAKELAARLLAKAIKRTPVGVYPRSTGKNGGTLRRGWTAKTEGEAESGGSKNAKAYAQSLRVVRSGSQYSLVIINPVKYASYVEFGHRTANHKGWVQGRFMLTMSVQEVQGKAQSIVEAKLEQFLGGLFHD